MRGVLNESTGVVHRRGFDHDSTACGVACHLDDDRLRVLPMDRALGEHDASRCGRCFVDGGGY